MDWPKKIKVQMDCVDDCEGTEIMMEGEALLEGDVYIIQSETFKVKDKE